MGTIKRLGLARIIKEFGVDFFFETGTWKGDSVAYALRFPFKRIYSSEIVDSIAARARERFRRYDNVEIVAMNSQDALRATMPRLDGNCLFWLDAHFPGAEEGIHGYNEGSNEDVRLPLAVELDLILRSRSSYSDVIFIDDLRIYENGPFGHGNLPPDILPPRVRNTQFLDTFLPTHTVAKFFQDEGYILLLPKRGDVSTMPEQTPRMSHTLVNRLLRRVY